MDMDSAPKKKAAYPALDAELIEYELKRCFTDEAEWGNKKTVVALSSLLVMLKKQAISLASLILEEIGGSSDFINKVFCHVLSYIDSSKSEFSFDFIEEFSNYN